MNNLPPISSPTGDPNPFPADAGINLPALAQAQKWILWGVLANILTLVMGLIVPIIAAGGSSAAPASMALLLAATRILIAIGVVIAVWNLANTLKMRWAFLPALLTIVPILGLVILLVLNARATKTLQEGGYQVGLLGAKTNRTL